MKTRRHFLAYIAHTILCFTLMPQSLWAFSDVIKQGLGATLVCPFNVINGPKSIGDVVIGCYSDTACGVYNNQNYSWGGRGGTPTFTNGHHSLSNDAMAAVNLTDNCANAGTQSIQLQVHNPGHTAFSLLCMQATVVSNVFTCTGGPYTLNINNL